MGRLATVGDEHRPLRRGLFGPAGVLIELPKQIGKSSHLDSILTFAGQIESMLKALGYDLFSSRRLLSPDIPETAAWLASVELDGKDPLLDAELDAAGTGTVRRQRPLPTRSGIWS